MPLPPFDLLDFSRRTRDAALDRLGEEPGLPDQVAALQAVLALTEGILSSGGIDLSRVACGPGCGHCCVVNVAVLPPEVNALAEYLEGNFTAGALEQVKRRLEELDEKVRGLDEEERVFLQEPCAFLDDDANCSVHPARPLLCRGVTSTDPGACEAAIALQALDLAPPITSNLLQKFLFDQAFLGLAGALELRGLDAGSRNLTGAMRERLIPSSSPRA